MPPCSESDDSINWDDIAGTRRVKKEIVATLHLKVGTLAVSIIPLEITLSWVLFKHICVFYFASFFYHEIHPLPSHSSWLSV